MTGEFWSARSMSLKGDAVLSMSSRGVSIPRQRMPEKNPVSATPKIVQKSSLKGELNTILKIMRNTTFRRACKSDANTMSVLRSIFLTILAADKAEARVKKNGTTLYALALKTHREIIMEKKTAFICPNKMATRYTQKTDGIMEQRENDDEK